MNSTITPGSRRWILLAGTLIFGAVAVVAVVTQAQWLPAVRGWASASGNAKGAAGHSHGGSSHAHDDHAHDDSSGSSHSHGDTGHSHGDSSHSKTGAADHKSDDHGHEGHDDASAIELSATAWKNVGLRTGVIKPTTFVRTVAMPAIVAERPGRSQVKLAAHMTGIVTRVFRMEGEAVRPGELLFTIRLTHEDLVTAQHDFLQSAQELDVIKQEIKRLQSAGEGVIAGRRLIEQQYQERLMTAAIHARRQALLLHGLTDQQVDQILATRQLLQTLTVAAPPFDDESTSEQGEHLYHVQAINVQRGQHVSAGAPLGVLADHRLLYVEGRAFEEDLQKLLQAAKENWDIDVSPVSAGSLARESVKLKVLYVADHIDSDSRALKFYLVLNNELAQSERRGEQSFIAWKYRPGQRMEVNIPTSEHWRNQIVLPVAAVVEEGAEAFVFQQNGDHFDRLAVHVIYRDKNRVVLENDKKIVGTTVAMSGAYQMQLALKNRAGGAVQAHGHSH